ncbi:hypothetical protein Ciccas_012550 [Cichlidogyrus casuarinus]|uniref:Protein tyrosine phosphatase domain-containing protein 1 n=1 Tax=Cichlidogyrus casuarinus TaxID=1844966 RepID=A0ABD2PN31_9PLAT
MNNACEAFCGGLNCKYCSLPSGLIAKHQAIPGIYSSWINDRILAMARPCAHLFAKNDLITKLKEAGIKTIINMQKTNEHNACGAGNLESGFSYDPSQFMSEGFFYYNFQWDDFGVGNLEDILEILHIFKFACKQGKVAVHCHAGLGRTGSLIACYLIFDERITGQEAIQLVRAKRPRSIQTEVQVNTVLALSKFLRPYQLHFASASEPKMEEFTLNEYIARQLKVYTDPQPCNCKHFPKLILNLLLNICRNLTSENCEEHFSRVLHGSKDAGPPPVVAPLPDPQTDVAVSEFVQLVKNYKYDPSSDAQIKAQINQDNDWLSIVRKVDTLQSMRLLLAWFYELKVRVP